MDEFAGKKLYVITGCTATGKTKYAIEFASKINAEIVSCDSLLVYKGMDIGTAKPTGGELEKVRHHALNLVTPEHNFDVAKYIEYAREAVNDILMRGKNVVIVGGSGLYLRGFYYPVVDDVPIDEEINTLVDDMYERYGLDHVVNELLKINDGECQNIDIKNPRRVLIALKRCLSSGKSIAELLDNFKNRGTCFDMFDKFTILLDLDKEEIFSRVVKRTEDMSKNGLVDEVSVLLKKYKNLCNSAKNAIGYRETISWLSHPTSEDDLKHKIISDTMKLVKKQRTWFRTQIPINAKYMSKNN